MSFLRFEEGVAPRGNITKVWRIEAAQAPGMTLGTIRWFSAWRRYCVFPESQTVFDVSCLRDIADFIERQMEARKINGQ